MFGCPWGYSQANLWTSYYEETRRVSKQSNEDNDAIRRKRLEALVVGTRRDYRTLFVRRCLGAKILLATETPCLEFLVCSGFGAMQRG